MLFLKREVKFEVHSWPGTNDIIPETTRNGLQVSLQQTFVVILCSLQMLKSSGTGCSPVGLWVCPVSIHAVTTPNSYLSAVDTINHRH